MTINLDKLDKHSQQYNYKINLNKFKHDKLN